MIVAMKKVTLVVLDNERTDALKALRQTGVLHVERREGTSQSLAELQSSLSRLDQARAILSEAKPAKGLKGAKEQILNRQKTMEIVDSILEAYTERREALERESRLSHELERLDAWGDINPADLDALGSKGIYLFPFEIPVSDYLDLPETAKVIVLGRDKKAMRIVLWGEDDLLPAGLPPSAHELELPEISTAEMRQELDDAIASIPAIDEKIAGLTRYMESLESLRKTFLKEIEFETVRAGMEKIEFGDESRVSASSSLAWLTGFVPAEDEHRIAEAAKAHGWAFVSDDPSGEDIVPTKLKNNRLVNLISPLMDFLGITPGYSEMDISAWFILFFGIFFAMIFGDGGYGAILVLVALGGLFAARRKAEKPGTVWYMLLYLASMTVAWGVITCTWFGLPMEKIPEFLKSIALPAFSNANPESAVNIKIFCFTIGLVQISLAHVIGVIRNIKTPKFLGELGTLMMTVGMYFVVLNLVVDSVKYPLDTWKVAMIGVGFLLNFCFINYSGSIVGGILESLKNIITMFLGVVNVFGDIMSYIRLWAVGLAGAAISATVNSMVGPMFGGLIMLLGIVILLFGHGLNLIMNVLSVIVHGVRLNTLEFSNHLGLTWSGFKYEPFSETAKK